MSDTAYQAGLQKFTQNKSHNCYECNSPHHMRRDCPKLKSQHSGQRHIAKNAAEDSGIKNYGFVMSNANDNTKEKKWLIDSGATSHMTHNRDIFTEYTKFEKPQNVCLDDGHIVEGCWCW